MWQSKHVHPRESIRAAHADCAVAKRWARARKLRRHFDSIPTAPRWKSASDNCHSGRDEGRFRNLQLRHIQHRTVTDYRQYTDAVHLSSCDSSPPTTAISRQGLRFPDLASSRVPSTLEPKVHARKSETRKMHVHGSEICRETDTGTTTKAIQSAFK